MYVDSIMEPTTIGFVDQYLKAGGAPFNIMQRMMDSYEGLAAMSNMIDQEVLSALGHTNKSTILDVVSRKIVETFDAEKADEEYNRTQELPEYIHDMLPHKAWRKAIYRLSEKFPKSTMISAALQKLADDGYQSEMTSINSASLHTNVFYSLLVECFEKIPPADNETLQSRMQGLINTVCKHEQNYFVAQYVLTDICRQLGSRSTPIERISEELESYMFDRYGQPQLAIHMRLALDGREVGGDDTVANAIVSIIQSAHAAPSDVMSLYKQYQGAFSSGTTDGPPSRLLRHGRVLMPIIEQTFSHLWGDIKQDTRTDLMDKYVWLVAYATVASDEDTGNVDKDELNRLITQLKEIRTELSVRPTQTTLTYTIHKILDWTRTAVLGYIVLRWVQDILSYDECSYYDTYFHSSEVPIPLLLLEEIAYRHPLLKPMVFAAYKETFECKVPGFSPEKQTKLQKVAINRIAVLVQLGYALPIIHYFDEQTESIDQSVSAYFIYRMLAQFEKPYPKEFYVPVLKLIEQTTGGIKTLKEKERDVVMGFLQSIDDELAKTLYETLSEGGSK